jgi:hypothetical protein
MNVQTPGLQYYVDKINSVEPFSFVRYGDGEWDSAILHRKAVNCDSTSLKIPGLVRDLQLSLISPPKVDNYIMALRPASVDQVPKVKQWLKANVKIQWHDCRVFCHASIKGQLNPLVKALRKLENLVFVGPLHLQNLRGFFPKSRHIIVADVDCYNNRAVILGQILAVNEPAFFSFSAGPATKVFIHQLFPTIGDRSFMLDLGSLWSVFCGHKIRSYHYSMTRETIDRNLAW